MSEKIDEIKALLRRPSWAAWGIVAFMVLCFILLTAYGCDRNGEAHSVTEPRESLTALDRLKERLAAIELAEMEETRLRQEADVKISEYLALGALAGGNKNLAGKYVIGMAISQYADARHLNPRLVAAIVKVEANGDILAESPKGAKGLMQVMPAQAARHGFVCDLYEVECNVNVGTAILADSIRRYGYVEGIERYNMGSRKLRGLNFYFKVKAALEKGINTQIIVNLAKSNEDAF